MIVSLWLLAVVPMDLTLPCAEGNKLVELINRQNTAHDSRIEVELRRLVQDGEKKLDLCKRSEPVWYMVLRSHELLSVEIPDALLSRARREAPASARLATLYARADGTLASALKAVELSEEYLPARVALARVYLQDNQPEKARDLLVFDPQLEATPHAGPSLARALIETDSCPLAVESARRGRVPLAQLEPEPLQWRTDESHVAEAKALECLGYRDFAALAWFRGAQQPRASESKKFLAQPTPEIRAALKRLARGKVPKGMRLDARERQGLKEWSARLEAPLVLDAGERANFSALTQYATSRHERGSRASIPRGPSGPTLAVGPGLLRQRSSGWAPAVGQTREPRDSIKIGPGGVSVESESKDGDKRIDINLGK